MENYVAWICVVNICGFHVVIDISEKILQRFKSSSWPRSTRLRAALEVLSTIFEPQKTSQNSIHAQG